MANPTQASWLRNTIADRSIVSTMMAIPQAFFCLHRLQREALRRRDEARQADREHSKWHLDLPSIQCLEDALAESPGALLLVSHDNYFLRRLTTISWQLKPAETGISFRLCVADSV